LPSSNGSLPTLRRAPPVRAVFPLFLRSYSAATSPTDLVSVPGCDDDYLRTGHPRVVPSPTPVGWTIHCVCLGHRNGVVDPWSAKMRETLRCSILVFPVGVPGFDPRLIRFRDALVAVTFFVRQVLRGSPPRASFTFFYESRRPSRLEVLIGSV